MADVNIYGSESSGVSRGCIGRRRNARVTRKYRSVMQTGEAEAPASARSPQYRSARPNTRPTATAGTGSYVRALGGNGLYTNLRAQRMDAAARRSS